MYHEYWGLHKPPFDNVPDPSMYVDCHRSMENAIAETLFAIEEGNESIAVIVGDVGLGKTLSIRMIMASLIHDQYKTALITNPGISFAQMLQEVIGQLTGKVCAEIDKVKLLAIFNRLLASIADEGKKALIFIDEANAITPINLENLRLLTSMQSDATNLFTMILAGQNEFARRLEHPKRANFFQRIGTYSRIDKLDSVDHVRTYVLTRLNLAGAKRLIFTEDAFEKIWEQSDYGVPRMINKLCKLCLKSGETGRLGLIDGRLVHQIGARANTLTGPAIQARKPRRRFPLFRPADDDGLMALPYHRDLPGYVIGLPENRQTGPIVPINNPIRPYPRIYKTSDMARGEKPYVRSAAMPMIAYGKSANSDIAVIYPRLFQPIEQDAGDFILLPTPQVCENQDVPMMLGSTTRDMEENDLVPVVMHQDHAEPMDDREFSALCISDTMEIGPFLIRIDVSENVLTQYQSSSPAQRIRMAGAIAADTLKKHPQLTFAYAADPVPIWQEIRDFVLNRFNHDRMTKAV